MGDHAHDRTAPDSAEGEVDLRGILRQLLRHKWTIIGVFATVVTATMLITMSLPRVYEAAATLEYDPNPPRPLGTDVPDVAASPGNYLIGKEWYQTQNAIIASRRIAAKVVERLGLNRDPAFMNVPQDERAAWKGADKELAVDELLANMRVKEEKGTRISRIEVNSGDPQRAATLANAVADAYMDWMVEERLGSTVRAVEWLGGQLDDVSKRLQGSEHLLYDFRRKNNVLSVSLEDQQNGVTQTLNSFSSALTEATTRRIQVEAKLRQLEAAVADDPMQVHASLVSESSAVSELRSQYYAALVERDTLATRYGANHPEMLRVQAHLDTLVASARQEIQGLVEALRSELREVRDVEQGLQQAKQQQQDIGLDLNLHQIEYNRLERERANNEKLHGLLLQRTTETNLSRLLRVSPVRLVDRARAPLEPVQPRPEMNLALGVILGLILGLGVAALRMRLDRSVRAPDDIEALGVTVLGLIPSILGEKGAAYAGAQSLEPSRARRKRRAVEPAAGQVKDLVVHTHPRSSVAECCRTIRTNLAFMSTDKPLRAMVITSPSPSEGKSTAAISLAITLAQSGRRVLLMDTDLRRPRLHKAFGVSARVGLTSILAGEKTLESCLQATQVEGLWLLPCGAVPPNPSELLHTASFSRVLTQVKDSFDVVLLDSSPVGVVIDAAIIGPQVDGAVLIAKTGQTTRDALGHALRQMRDVGTKVLGCVLNDVDLSKQGGYGGYYYYRGSYYYSSEDPADGGAPPSPPSAASPHSSLAQ